MELEQTPARNSAKMIWAGRIISAIPILMMPLGGLFFFLFKRDVVASGMVELGYPASAAMPILATEIICGILYAIPQTAVLGAILLTGYLGGATASHVRASQPYFFPIIFGVLVWLGLYLRDARLRSLMPLRRLQ